MPRSPQLAIFVRAMTDIQTDYFTPCTCAWGNKRVGVARLGAYMYLKELPIGKAGLPCMTQMRVVWYLYVFREKILVYDASLLEVEHDVRQLVGVLQNLIWRQAILQADITCSGRLG